MLLDELKADKNSNFLNDIEKIRICGIQLLQLTNAILDATQQNVNQHDWDLKGFSTKIRWELITPLSTVIGYCEMLLEEAPAKVIPDLDKIQTAAQQLLSMVSDIIHLAQQQLYILESGGGYFPELIPQSLMTTALAQSVASTIQSLQADTSESLATESGTILIVDDNETNCELLSRQLERQGHRVAIATNGLQALRLLKAIPYDLILLDVVMPGMSGFEVLMQLKRNEQWRHIPVIMVSALEELDSAVKCIQLGAEDYLHKPFEPTLLKARIEACLEKKRLRDQEILYLQQVERLTEAAVELESKTFDPDSLTDLTQRTDELGQLGRVFQRMACEINSREQRLEQQVQMLQVAIDEAHKRRIVAEISETDHFRQLQKRAKHRSTQIQRFDTAIQPYNGTQDYRSSPPLLLPSVPAFSNASQNMPQIVSIHSFRGGTGKSNLTSNIAASIASQGKRVGIVDTDLQSPGIHVLFGLDEETIDRTLNDYLWGNCSMRESAYDVSHVLLERQQHPKNGSSIYLVPASVKTNNITRILREGYDEETLIEGLCELIRELNLDYLLIDTHPGINEETLHAITVSSVLVLVLRPDYQDYQGTAVTVDLARILTVSEMLLVVNKAMPMSDLEAFRQQVEAAYDVPVAEILPFSEQIAHLASSDIFCLRYPNHPWAQAIDSISQQILSQRRSRCLC
ncbi:MAG: response regulator [Cyanobacteria bacterium CRU_2_1]|nr:response regulator [Cyanobacteria bacterium RU_5_0]NJR62253.1 response regulator [Cyanobacteria bacterium CRU_2_1]